MGNPAVKTSEDRAVAHKDMANAIRALAMDAVEKAKSGHPGMPMGMADVATVLFTQFLKFDASAPDWPDRDRFVLSAGHGSMLLYSLLHLTGYPGMTMEELANFRQLGSKTAGHPEYGHAPGIETTTGPLGQGLANAVGMALAERLLNARLRRRRRRSLHLCARRRRLPDGGHQPGGDLARRAPQAQQADRAVRRQPDLDRRADIARRLRRPDRALQGLGLERRLRSTGTIPMPSPSPSRRAALRSADADRLQDHHRLRRADQAGQGLDPRRAAGRRRDQGRAREARLGPCRLRGAAPRARRLARRGARGAQSRKAWEQRSGQARRRAGAALGDPIDASAAQGPRRGGRRDQGRVRGRAAQDRHPRRLAEGAREARPGAAVPDRWLGRPHGLQRHAHQAACRVAPEQLRRQLHPLRRARACHGRGHERARPARRHRALRRALSWCSRTTAGRRSASPRSWASAWSTS